MKKSWFGVGLVFLLTVALIAGCGGGGKSSNGGGGTPKDPSKIVITSTHTADLSAATNEEKYAKAYKLTVEQIKTMLDYDSDIDVAESANGITFTSTVVVDPVTQLPKGDARNRYIRIAYNKSKLQGMLDLTAGNRFVFMFMGMWI
ncbi:MAG TPA: hypothetical protein PLC07_07035 [Bacillota bacterium]|nr:hypothetical protein [Bacillota bacterium]HPT87031.1 hypothetical protein [Bacillota bacterium]